MLPRSDGKGVCAVPIYEKGPPRENYFPAISQNRIQINLREGTSKLRKNENGGGQRTS